MTEELDLIELTDAEVEDLERQELEAAAEETNEGRAQAGYDSNVVTLDGREFEIGEPTIGIVLRIIRVFGLLGVRGEKVALRSLRSLVAGSKDQVSASGRAVLFGMLAALQPEDLIALGSAVLQFEDDREGRKWLKAHEMRLAPLVRAMFLNLANSQDLRDSLQDFFVGLGMVDGVWSQIGTDL